MLFPAVPPARRVLPSLGYQRPSFMIFAFSMMNFPSLYFCVRSYACSCSGRGRVWGRGACAGQAGASLSPTARPSRAGGRTYVFPSEDRVAAGAVDVRDRVEARDQLPVLPLADIDIHAARGRDGRTGESASDGSAAG